MASSGAGLTAGEPGATFAFMETARCEAVVIGGSDYREADRLVTLFSQEYGKIRGIAPGARRSMRRFGGALELFARIQLVLTPTDGLSRLKSADIITIHAGLRSDLAKIALAGYACELTECLTPEAMPQPRIFRLLTSYFDHLETNPVSPSDRRFFEFNLLNILGYRPPLEECGRCGAGVAGEPVFAGKDGTVVCQSCRCGARPVSPGTVNLLKKTLATGRFGAITFSAEMLAEADLLLSPHIAAHLQRPLRTLAFLNEMAAG